MRKGLKRGEEILDHMGSLLNRILLLIHDHTSDILTRGCRWYIKVQRVHRFHLITWMQQQLRLGQLFASLFWHLAA